MPLLQVFIDGLGINEYQKTNPLYLIKHPFLRELFNGRPHLFKAIDPLFSQKYLPQSATGQTALLCGVNPFHFVKRPQSGFPGPSLIKVIHEYSIFKQIKKIKGQGTFANAYFKHINPLKLRKVSVTTHSVLAAENSLRTLKDLWQGNAVYQEFTNSDLLKRGFDVPLWTAEQAASNLLAIALNHDYTLYEYFQTDIAGHKEDLTFKLTILSGLSKFLQYLFEKAPPNFTIIISSDHGNIEDLSTKNHTYNKVPLIVEGPLSSLFAEVDDLSGLCDVILKGIKKSFEIKAG